MVDCQMHLILLHAEQPKLQRVLAVLSAIGLNIIELTKLYREATPLKICNLALHQIGLNKTLAS